VDGAHYREHADLPVPNTLVSPGMERYFVNDKYLLPDYQWEGQDAFLLTDRYLGWGAEAAAEPQEGGDIPRGRNGKVGAPP
jgi:hypothetical protein